MSAGFKVVSMKVHLHEENDTPLMYFQCAGCERLVCAWCEGAADDHPSYCNTCWKKATEMEANAP